MLVLSRKKNERIVIAGEIVITLVGIEGNRVRIGISAPPDVSILREELVGQPCPNNDPAEK
jgi:carbon storage regulator